MKKLDVELIERQINYKFNNIDLLHQAFTHSSYARENKCASNQVLEFYGDEVLDFFISKKLSDWYGYIRSEEEENFDLLDQRDEYVTLNEMTEADLTEIKKKLVDNTMLAHRIELMGNLQDYLYLGIGAISQNIQNDKKTKADLFEAILGAVALDCEWNFKILEDVVYLMTDVDSYLTNGFESDDEYEAVQLIQKWFQKRLGMLPNYIYQEIDYNNEYDEKYIEATLEFDWVGRHYLIKGEALNKADARTDCAKKAYKELNNNNCWFSIEDDCPSAKNVNIDNAVNVLQELSQKGWISPPEYNEMDEPNYDINGNPEWKCICFIKSNKIIETAFSANKKTAKKLSAYLCVCDLMGFENKYDNKGE